jgi:hypothetical protein
MSNNVNISNTTPNSVEVSVDKNIITILQPSGNNQIVVGQTTTNLIEVRTPGPQGPPGQAADISGLLTTASFNQFTESFNTGSFSGSFIGEFSGSGAELSNIPATAIVGLNLSQISSGAYSASISEAGLLVNNRIVADSFTGSLQGTSSWSENAQTALFAPNYLPLTGGTINGNIILNGTASIAFLNVTYESASVIYSTGSNQFGDAINDTQTLIGTVIISGSQRITGSLNAPNITGSLLGTASFAVSSSFAQNAQTASYANNANLLDGIDSTRFATTGSNTFTSNQIISGTLLVTGHVDGTLLGTASYANNSDLLDGIDSTQFAKTGSNTFVGNQIISGSLIVRENLTVLGSASVTYISESTLNIGTNLITVNTINPGARFGGLAVIDSGSSPQISASFLYDSIKDEFVFVHHSIPITSSVFLQGPETYNDLGNEIYLTANRIPKGSGIEHLNDSNISDDGSVVSINSNTQITGSLTVSNGITGSFSGSGANLFDIPASGIVGLNLSQISSGSYSASISENGLLVNNRVVADSFSGSFSGSGANLFNIPASGIVGLNLSQILSGSVSASISPNGGLQVNTNVTAPSFTGSLFGTASWSQNAVTSSYTLDAASQNTNFQQLFLLMGG